LNQVFGDKWTDFKQLALLAYADQATFQDFWTINNTQDVVDFIQRNGQVIA
jgi:predicted amino acid dehydrogenase